MTGQALVTIGIIIMILGSGIGTYLIQKGRTKIAFESSQKLIKHFNSLDSSSRAEIISNSNLNKNEIVLLVKNQTKSSAVEIISEVEDKFGIISEDLIEKEKEIEKLKRNEERRKTEARKIAILKKTPPKFQIQALFINNDDLVLQLKPLNNVPFKFRYHISNKDGAMISNQLLLESLTLHPKKGIEFHNYTYDSLPFIIKNKKIPLKGFHLVNLSLSYESIYFEETKNSSLTGRINKKFVIDLDKKIVLAEK